LKSKRKKKLTIAMIRRQYDQYNRSFFRNSLPKAVTFLVVKRRDCLAETSEFVDAKTKAHLHFQIEFSRELWNLQSRRVAYTILLHEMVHLAAGLHNNHNKVFEANRKRLIDAGAYDCLL